MTFPLPIYLYRLSLINTRLVESSLTFDNVFCLTNEEAAMTSAATEQKSTYPHFVRIAPRTDPVPYLDDTEAPVLSPENDVKRVCPHLI